MKTISKIGNYRWTICALLFFATTVNYLDRQVLSLLKPDLEKEFGWSKTDYANITSVFQIVYAISMLFAGRIIDRLGTKKGYIWAIVIWSFGAIIHAYSISIGQQFATILGWMGIGISSISVLGFMVSRAVLGFGEAGNFPAAIKATAEWFPAKERSFATGIFNSGANVGAILAPLTVPWIAKNWGWESAFIIIGLIGLIWIFFWWVFYDKPENQKRISAEELNYINSGNETQPVANQKTEKVSWLKLLGYKQTWAFGVGKFMTDGVWWFFLFWLPAYLNDQYGMSTSDIAIPLTVLYTMTMFGSIYGGWFPAFFLKKGYASYDARMRAMLMIAFFPLVILAAQPFGANSYWVPVLLIGIGAAAHQAWSANLFTTVSDMFPKKATASVVGIGGMLGGLGGVIISKVGGWLFDSHTAAGINQSWVKARETELGGFLDQLKSVKILDKGQTVDILHKDLFHASTDFRNKLLSEI